jgi:hypothetical protein
MEQASATATATYAKCEDMGQNGNVMLGYPAGHSERAPQRKFAHCFLELDRTLCPGVRTPFSAYVCIGRVCLEG